MTCIAAFQRRVAVTAERPMAESLLVRTVPLENGIILDFRDCSNRYFGDFHRLLLAVEGRVVPADNCLSDELKMSVADLPDCVLCRWKLERMGVSSDRLSDTMEEMIDSFIDSTKDYLERPGMPEQLLKKRQTEKNRRRRSPLGGALSQGV